MRRFLLLFTLAALVLFSASCDVICNCADEEVRQEVTELKTALTTWFTALDAWNNKVSKAVCQLESDVYDVTDTGGDRRSPQGPEGSPGSDRLCPNGPGDPTGDPPNPPDLL